jgi:hypothetical protein
VHTSKPNPKHYERQQRRPLKQKAKHDHDEGDVLRMADIGVRTRCSQLVISLRSIEFFPGCSEKNETAENQ